MKDPNKPICLIAHFNGEVYSAFYIPPLIEKRKGKEIKEYGKETLEKISIGQHPKIYTLPGINGNTKVDVEEIVRKVVDNVTNNDTILYRFDGTHRSYLAMCSGRKIRSVIIENPEEELQTFPVPTEYLTITREKPERDYKFINPNYNAWPKLKDLGIDG